MSTISDVSISQINSTSYIDVVGLLLGETRLPGEPASSFVRRLESIAQSRKDHSYEGCLEQINTELGFSTAPYITITSTDPNASISFNIAGLSLVSSTETLLIPIALVAQDTVWEWVMLSTVVAQVNAAKTFTATLLVEDGVAFQLARQSNIFLVSQEAITQQFQTLQYPGYVPNSGLISSSSLTFTVVNGILNLNQAPGVGTTFAYEYRILPYDLVGSPVACIGLTDPGFSDAAVQSNGAIVYQAQEFIQQVMSVDLSYWTR